MDSIGPVELWQEEGAPGIPQEGLPCSPDSSELVSSALGFCSVLTEGCQEQDWLKMMWDHVITPLQHLPVFRAFHI